MHKYFFFGHRVPNVLNTRGSTSPTPLMWVWLLPELFRQTRVHKGPPSPPFRGSSKSFGWRFRPGRNDVQRARRRERGCEAAAVAAVRVVVRLSPTPRHDVPIKPRFPSYTRRRGRPKNSPARREEDSNFGAQFPNRFPAGGEEERQCLACAVSGEWAFKAVTLKCYFFLFPPPPPPGLGRRCLAIGKGWRGSFRGGGSWKEQYTNMHTLGYPCGLSLSGADILVASL